MNKDRRKMIDSIADMLEICQQDVTTVGEEEQQYADDMPENMQQGDRYEKAEEIAQALDSIATDIENIINELREVEE